MSKYAKAFTACAVAFLGVVLVALDDGTVDASEWVKAAIAALTALGATWAIPNAQEVARRTGG